MKKMKISLVTVLVMVMAFAMFGCGGGETGNTSTTNDAPVNETKSVEITIKGSDTMLHINTTLAEAYMNLNPNVEITVAGGGSGTGIAAMMNGTTDISAASRRMKETERVKFEQGGQRSVEYAIARDGIGVVVHPNNPVNELTVKQIGDIYIGKITNWSEVGGVDAEIVALSRDNSSGTYAFFQEKVLNKEDYRADAKLMASNSAIVAETSQNENAIGYVGLGYVASAGDSIRALGVSEDGSPYFVPSQETVASGDYSIARPLHLYILESATKEINDFIDFCLSLEGQNIVGEIGFIPVK